MAVVKKEDSKPSLHSRKNVVKEEEFTKVSPVANVLHNGTS